MLHPPPHVPQDKTTSDDSRIPGHGRHCPVPGICTGSSHRWVPFWGLHLHLTWGVSHPSELTGIASPTRRWKNTVLTPLLRKSSPPDTSLHGQSPWMLHPRSPDSEGRMGLYPDTVQREELGSVTGWTPTIAHCAPRGLACLSGLETCPG